MLTFTWRSSRAADRIPQFAAPIKLLGPDQVADQVCCTDQVAWFDQAALPIEPSFVNQS
jgi:hypothetical protein